MRSLVSIVCSASSSNRRQATSTIAGGERDRALTGGSARTRRGAAAGNSLASAPRGHATLGGEPAHARGRRPAGSLRRDETRCHSAASAARCRSVSAHAPRALDLAGTIEIALLCSSGGSSTQHSTQLALHRSRTPALSPRGTAARICCYTHTQQSVR